MDAPVPLSGISTDTVVELSTLLSTTVHDKVVTFVLISRESRVKYLTHVLVKCMPIPQH